MFEDLKRDFGLFEMQQQKLPSNLLTDRFLVPPFSVFDTKQGYWQERKRDWVNIGIKSEIGREAKSYSCNKDTQGDKYSYMPKIDTGTSIFDPVLCEIIYRWFSVDGAKILDPFAGGSVRGIVAACLGRNYSGVDLNNIQIKENVHQFEKIKQSFTNIEGQCVWKTGDSLNIKTIFNNKFDLLFTCPPYFDLEVYSNDPADISNKNSYDEFLNIYSQIIKNSCSMLKEDSFAAIVVGDIRDKKQGAYYNFVGDTISIFKKLGLLFYNEAILVNVIGSLPVRIGKQFNGGRKLGKQHQNVLIFYKGNTKNIKNKFKVLNFSE